MLISSFEAWLGVIRIMMISEVIVLAFLFHVLMMIRHSLISLIELTFLQLVGSGPDGGCLGKV